MGSNIFKQYSLIWKKIDWEGHGGSISVVSSCFSWTLNTFACIFHGSQYFLNKIWFEKIGCRGWGGDRLGWFLKICWVKCKGFFVVFNNLQYFYRILWVERNQLEGIKGDPFRLFFRFFAPFDLSKVQLGCILFKHRLLFFACFQKIDSFLSHLGEGYKHFLILKRSWPRTLSSQVFNVLSVCLSVCPGLSALCHHLVFA